MKTVGVAPIKAEFLLNAPVSNFDDLPENVTVEDENPKRKRLRGQNKSRPRDERPTGSERLCPAIASETECPFKEKCVFQHDVRAYWLGKPEDINQQCHLFNTFGRCSFGLACRFATSHVDIDTLKNIVNEAKFEGDITANKFTESGRASEINQLPKDLQRKLQRREYDFSACAKYLKLLKANKKRSDGKSSAASDAAKFECAADVMDISDNFDPAITCGSVTDEDTIRLRDCEKKKLNFDEKLYLAPLTTVGNLPFRRICVEFGAEVTCGEMALCTSILQGNKSEFALIQRHKSEKLFGVQLCGGHVDAFSNAAQVLVENSEIDFIDINMGCPIDLVCAKGAGCMLMRRTRHVGDILRGMQYCMKDKAVPITVKMRTGIYEGKQVAHCLIPELAANGIPLFSLHGRSREARYTKFPDWNYIESCAKIASSLNMSCFGCGDVLSYEDYCSHLENVNGILIARGALMKPWIFTEIRERRHWDISATERLDILKTYVNYGLEHWGSDQVGVDKTRRFFLEWLSFLHRYIPVGLLERLPQRINERPPYYKGRNELETLMASSNCKDWIKISEMLLGPVSTNFTFLPKHKANSY